MAAIQFRTLGALDLRAADGRELHSLLAQPKRIALLAYLCIAEPRGYHRRDTLLGLFWPNADEEHARTSLRKSLHLLRRSLGEHALLTRGDDEVAVDFDQISCDVVAFEYLVRARQLEEALEFYRGDLLPGFIVDDIPEFDQWLEAERVKVRRRAATAAGEAAEHLENAGDLIAALAYARRSRELNPTDERALTKLTQIQIKSGDRAGAIQSYDAFARALAAEYETSPSPETRAAIERLRRVEGDVALPENEPREVHSADDGAQRQQANVAPAAGLSRRSPRRLSSTLTLAGFGLVVFAGVASWRRLSPPRSEQVVRYTLAVDSSEALAEATPWSGRIAISPDGSRFAYIGRPRNQLLIRARNELRATPIPGTEQASTPFFSPDGRSVGLLGEKKMQIASLTGGRPFSIATELTGVAGGSWGSDGFIYADGFDAAPLARVEAKPDAIAKWFTVLDTAKGEIDHVWPDVLPNGKGVLFTVTFSGKNTASGKASFAIAVADIPSGKHRILIDGAVYPRYAAGRLLYVTTQGTLMMVPFDQETLRITGEPTALIDGLRVGRFGATDVAVSSTGTLIYSVGSEPIEQELLWVNRDGQVHPVDSTWQGFFQEPAISPDGKRLAISKSPDGRTADIWIKSLDGGGRIQLTHEGVFNRDAQWTPDGRSVTFSSNAAGGHFDLWTKPADGSRDAQLQLHKKGDFYAARWSPDGKWLVAQTEGATGSDIDLVGIRPGVDTAPVTLVSSRFEESYPALSPDGRWLAYNSDESGSFEIYVVPFPNTRAAKWVISSGGGINPKWSHRGDELFFRGAPGDLFVVNVNRTPRLSFGRPRRLFAAPWKLFGFTGYDVAPDDNHFLMIHQLAPPGPDKLIVVDNWFEELRTKRH